MEIDVGAEPNIKPGIQPCRLHDGCSRLRVTAHVRLAKYGRWLVSMTIHHLGKNADPIYTVERLFLTLDSKDRPPDGLNLGPVAEAVIEAMTPPKAA